MSRKEQHPGGVKLTAKTARTLAMQEFGTTRGLTKSTSFVGAYFMEFGNLRIEICADAACIAVRVVLAHGTGSSVKYFDPDTLQENFKAISEFMGPSTAQMAGNSIVLADVEEKAQEVINKRVEHEITRILNGYGG